MHVLPTSSDDKNGSYNQQSTQIAVNNSDTNLKSTVTNKENKDE